MGGSIIGILSALSYFVAMTCFAAFISIIMDKNLPSSDQKEEYMEYSNHVRLYRTILVLISNIFFIEWAYDDYRALRLRNKKTTWRQLLTRVLCCFQS